MKRLLGLWGAAIVILVLVCSTALAAVPGDVTGNGAVDVSDVQCTVLTALNPQPPACLGGPGAADLNCDKVTDVVDVQLIVMIVLKHPANGVPADKDKNGNNIVDACEGAVVCGNGICDPGETEQSCPSDCGTSSYVPGDVLITEIMKDPEMANDSKGEWFEVRVLGANGVDFKGWSLQDEGGESYVVSAIAKYSIGTVVIFAVEDDPLLNGGLPTDKPMIVYSGFNLDNAGDELMLVAPGGVIIDEVKYTAATFPDIPGHAMTLNTTAFDYLQNDNGANWCPAVNVWSTSAGDRGSPGVVNPQCAATPTCGNGQITAWEECDDGNKNPGDGCDAKCQKENSCGNGVLEAAKGEQCDDGNLLPFDGCDAMCKKEAVCGDGVCSGPGGETCSNCPQDCTGPCGNVCGNGVKEPPEECDDGPDGSPSCTNDCKSKIVNCLCGDGKKECTEQCDDGNKINGDGCTANCEIECPTPPCGAENICGNGILEPANDETCDDGCLKGIPGVCGETETADNGDGCDKWCKLEPKCCPVSPCCCDKVKDPGEECDDGNDVSGDGCDNLCKIEVGAFGFQGSVKYNGTLGASDKVTVEAYKVPVTDPLKPPDGTQSAGKKEFVNPAFPVPYQCSVQAAGQLYPLVTIDKGGDGSPDVGKAYAPAPITVVQNEWTTGIDFDIVETQAQGTITGTLTYAFTPGANDELRIMVTSNKPGSGQPAIVKMLEIKSNPIPISPYNYTINGVKTGTVYVMAILDVGDNNPQQPKTGEDYRGAYPTWASPGTVTVNANQTTPNVNFTLNKL